MSFSTIINLPKHHRRTVFGLITLLIIAIGIYDIWMIERTTEYIPLSEVLRPIWTGAVTVALLAIFFWIFVPRNHFGHGHFDLKPHEILDQFNELLESSSNWENHANLGRWMRSAVLKKLSGPDRTSVNATIINPFNQSLLEDFCDYRSKRPDLNSAENSKEHLKIELLTTICTCAWYMRNTNVNISLGTLDHFNPDRIDGTSEGLIVTLEGKREAAVYVPRATRLNSILELRIASLTGQATAVDLAGFPKCDWSSVCDKDVSSYLVSAGIIQRRNKSMAQKICDAMMNMNDPYPQ